MLLKDNVMIKIFLNDNSKRIKTTKKKSRNIATNDLIYLCKYNGYKVICHYYYFNLYFSTSEFQHFFFLFTGHLNLLL